MGKFLRLKDMRLDYACVLKLYATVLRESFLLYPAPGYNDSIIAWTQADDAQNTSSSVNPVSLG